jgi:NAD-dependent SIR2 family protein deacetylase
VPETPQTLLVERVADLLQRADHVLIAAGAGLSVDAGFDYNSERQFVSRYPVLARRGPRCRYHVFGYPFPDPATQWGHMARHLEELRIAPPPDATPYTALGALTAGKSRFVLTSNADDLFERTGFDPNALWTRQGSYSRLQCLGACHPESTWSALEWIPRAAAAVDLHTETLNDPALHPACPRCGGVAMMNVRGGDWFLDTPYEPQGRRFAAWLDAARRGRLLVLDIGTGFNTPGVIRWPAEQITARHPDAHLVRVNLHHPAVPRELGERALSVPVSGAALWAALGGSEE